MRTTTIRVDVETHHRLLEISRATGESLMNTVRQATAALHRQRFAGLVVSELERLRSDPEGWEAYLSDAESTSVADGIT